jgi:beta-lactamase class A
LKEIATIPDVRMGIFLFPGRIKSFLMKCLPSPCLLKNYKFCISIFGTAFCLLTWLPLSAQVSKDRKLENKISKLVAGFHGDVGVYVKNLQSGKSAGFDADSIFPTASMIKIPILIGITRKLEDKELFYDQTFIYKDSLLYAGSDILGSFKQDEKIELGKLMMLMLTTSDNTASLWLQSLAGGGSRINELLDTLGFRQTKVNSRTPGRSEHQRKFGWGQTTPFEMATIMEKIYRGEVFTKQSSERMLRLLGRNYFDEHAISQIPPFIFVASKNGAVDASRSETLLVMAPHGPYVFSVITKNQADQSWNSQNEGWVLATKLSDLLWEYYEPRFSRRKNK